MSRNPDNFPGPLPAQPRRRRATTQPYTPEDQAAYLVAWEARLQENRR